MFKLGPNELLEHYSGSDAILGVTALLTNGLYAHRRVYRDVFWPVRCICKHNVYLLTFSHLHWSKKQLFYDFFFFICSISYKTFCALCRVIKYIHSIVRFCYCCQFTTFNSVHNLFNKLFL